MARQVDTFRQTMRLTPSCMNCPWLQSRSITWKFNLLNKKPCFYGIQLCVVLDYRASLWLENPALSFCTSSSHALSLISETLDCMKRWHISTNRFFAKSSGYVRSLITKTVDTMKIESSTKTLFLGHQVMCWSWLQNSPTAWKVNSFYIKLCLLLHYRVMSLPWFQSQSMACKFDLSQQKMVFAPFDYVLSLVGGIKRRLL